MKRFVINRIVPQCKLKELCKALDIVIKLSSIRNNEQKRPEWIGDKNINTEQHYEIGLIDEHYFLIKKLNLHSIQYLITTALKNYQIVIRYINLKTRINIQTKHKDLLTVMP